MSSARTLTNIILGATGSGKTRLIRALLARRPRGERWAVLSNDLGVVNLGSAPGAAEGHVIVREVGGCICCTGRVTLRTALVALLREARPHRLLIEAAAAAAPSAVWSVLKEPALASVLDAQATIATANAVQLTDTRYVLMSVYREQIGAANLLVLSAPGDAPAEKRGAARTALAELTSSGTPVFEIAEDVDLSALDYALTRGR